MRRSHALPDEPGLLARFAAVGDRYSYPVRRPDSAQLFATLGDAGGNPNAAALVGDHHSDIASAATTPANLVAWACRPPEIAGASPVAVNFGEVPRLGEACLA